MGFRQLSSLLKNRFFRLSKMFRGRALEMAKNEA